MRRLVNPRAPETGSAFVISILVMFVLTVLGMALMLTTSTEADIATNYRWGEMAFFNADAALEYGKNVLGEYTLTDGNFQNALPAPRTVDQMGTEPVLGPTQTDATRDNQYYIEQPGNVRMYIGKVVYDRVNERHLQFDYRAPGDGLKGGELGREGVQDIQGTATIWIRRAVVGPPVGDPDPRLRDDLQNDRAILTAEGTAPNFESAATGRPSATRRLELTVKMTREQRSGGDYGHSVAGGSGGSDTDAGAKSAISSGSISVQQ